MDKKKQHEHSGGVLCKESWHLSYDPQMKSVGHSIRGTGFQKMNAGNHDLRCFWHVYSQGDPVFFYPDQHFLSQISHEFIGMVWKFCWEKSAQKLTPQSRWVLTSIHSLCSVEYSVFEMCAQKKSNIKKFILYECSLVIPFQIRCIVSKLAVRLIDKHRDAWKMWQKKINLVNN